MNKMLTPHTNKATVDELRVAYEGNVAMRTAKVQAELKRKVHRKRVLCGFHLRV